MLLIEDNPDPADSINQRMRRIGYAVDWQADGLSALRSHDGNRFWPGMGTLFLRMMGEAFAVALHRFGG